MNPDYLIHLIYFTSPTHKCQTDLVRIQQKAIFLLKVCSRTHVRVIEFAYIRRQNKSRKKGGAYYATKRRKHI